MDSKSETRYLFVKIIVLLFSKIKTESEPIKYGFIEHYEEWKRQTTDLVCNLPVVSFEKWWNENIIESVENCVYILEMLLMLLITIIKRIKLIKRSSKNYSKKTKDTEVELKLTVFSITRF